MITSNKILMLLNGLEREILGSLKKELPVTNTKHSNNRKGFKIEQFSYMYNGQKSNLEYLLDNVIKDLIGEDRSISKKISPTTYTRRGTVRRGSYSELWSAKNKSLYPDAYALYKKGYSTSIRARDGKIVVRGHGDDATIFYKGRDKKVSDGGVTVGLVGMKGFGKGGQATFNSGDGHSAIG